MFSLYYSFLAEPMIVFLLSSDKVLPKVTPLIALDSVQWVLFTSYLHSLTAFDVSHSFALKALPSLFCRGLEYSVLMLEKVRLLFLAPQQITKAGRSGL